MQKILSRFKKFPRCLPMEIGSNMPVSDHSRQPHGWFLKILLLGMIIGSSTLARAQQTVTGKITAEDDGQGMPGVNIVIKGTTTGSVSDADGNYNIQAPSGESILVFSSIGYASQEIVVGGRSVINLIMSLDAKQLEEIVVVGYGTVKKSDVTGALSRVTSETIQERPAQNLLQALQGKAAGVHVSSNFKPGELPVLRVRGNRSLSASNDPLYVVDGIPLVTALGVGSFTMNDLNPNDIASIEVLKDASATAIYGSRGANGVVLITTKKGAKGKIAVNFNSSVSLDRYRSLTDWMSGGEYIDRWRLALINGRQYNKDIPNNGDFNVPAVMWYPDPELDKVSMNLASDPVVLESIMMGYEWNDDGSVKMRSTTEAEKALGWPDIVPAYNSENIRSYDWLDDATRQGVTQNHQLSLTAGTETSRLLISLGYYDQLGVQRDQDFKRYTANINGDISPNKWLTLGTSVIASMSLQNFGINGPNTSNTGSKDLYSRATDQFPFNLPRNEDGSWRRFSQLNNQLFNPLIDIDQSVNERRSMAVMTSTFAEIKFTPWLKYRANLGAQYRHFRSGSWTGPEATNHLVNRPNTAGLNAEEHFSWVAENLLYFDKTFAEVHTVGVTLLQSAQKSRRENVGANVTNMIYDVSYWYDLASNSNGRPDGYGSGFTENTLMSYMGRVNYTLMNKYLITASGRFDGASVLAPGHKWHFFPSLALAWKLHEESFMQGLNWINEFKPRFGYGITGNSSVNPYTTSGPLSRNPYVFGSSPAIGYLPQLVKNPLLGWERTAQMNIGLDFGFIRNRISGSVELYEQNTTDLIMTKTLPAVSGYVQKIENIGKTRNRGIEITLSAVNLEKTNFTWSMDINWSRNREEIVELMNGKEDMVGQNLFIGQPLQVFRQMDNAGIWGSTAEDLEEMAKFNAGPGKHNFRPGTVRVIDQNGDYVIDGEDMVIRGTNRPKWTGGITNTFRYKNWQLSSFIYARWGQTYFGGYPNSYGGIWPNGRVENDIWSWDNPGGRWPMPNSDGAKAQNITAAMQYNDGSFVTVRNISLSYTFPKDWIRRMSINELALNVQVLNPFISGHDVVKWGINPDDDTNWDRASSNTNPLGGTNNNTILPQSIVFGLRAGF